jgi:hypothetical protein
VSLILPHLAGRGKDGVFAVVAVVVYIFVSAFAVDVDVGRTTNFVASGGDYLLVVLPESER